MPVLTKQVFVLKNLLDTERPTNFSLLLAFRKLDNTKENLCRRLVLTKTSSR